jgi:Xaa-Pro aminopeptidase
MPDIFRFQKAIREERLDGWLFVNFAHRDRLTDSLLGLAPDAVSTRRWFYFVPATGEPVKIVHAIEPSILDALPGSKSAFYAHEELTRILSTFAGKRVAILSDATIQVLSTFDAASAELVRNLGIETVSAAGLVQRVRGILDREGIASHEKAAKSLYAIVRKSWEFVESAFARGEALFEAIIRDYMLSLLASEGLITDHPPIVAVGANSGNPHYSVTGSGNRVRTDEILQFDIWAKSPGGIYADISWVGFTGSDIPKRTRERFSLLCDARDRAVAAIEETLNKGISPTGADIDRIVRARLLESFPPAAIRHRTGHGIDEECHGAGVNLDSVEFPDTRRILEGSCFSVEPGIYFNDEGYRTEIDVYISNGKPVISGDGVQDALLHFQESIT